MGQLAGRLGPRWFLVIGPLVVAAGMLLGQRIGSDTSYWTSVFPAMASVVKLPDDDHNVRP